MALASAATRTWMASGRPAIPWSRSIRKRSSAAAAGWATWKASWGTVRCVCAFWIWSRKNSSRRRAMATTATPISEQERVKRQRALVATIANLRIEDLHLDDESKRIFQRHADGEISFEEFRAAVSELNERRFGPISVSRNGHS